MFPATPHTASSRQLINDSLTQGDEFLIMQLLQTFEEWVHARAAGLTILMQWQPHDDSQQVHIRFTAAASSVCCCANYSRSPPQYTCLQAREAPPNNPILMQLLRDEVAVSAEVRTAALRVLRQAVLAATSDAVRAPCCQPMA